MLGMSGKKVIKTDQLCGGYRWNNTSIIPLTCR